MAVVPVIKENYMKKLLTLIFLLIATPAFAVWTLTASDWRNGTGENTLLGNTKINDIDSASYSNIVVPLDRLLANYTKDVQLDYLSASTITVKAGEIVCSNAAGTIRRFRQNNSDTTVTWSNIDTGSEAASTTYYIYAIADVASSTSFTVMISASAVAPTGATYFKRIGTFYNNADSNIINVYSYINYIEPQQSAVSSSYVVNTIYQNTSSKKRIIVADFSSVSDGSYDNISVGALVGQVTPPTNNVAVIQIKTNNGTSPNLPVVFVVPSGWYWKLSSTYGNLQNIDAWEIN